MLEQLCNVLLCSAHLSEPHALCSVSKPSLAQSSHLAFPEQIFALRVNFISKQATTGACKQSKTSKKARTTGNEATQASKPLFSNIVIEIQEPSIDESHWRVLLVLYIHVFHCQSIITCGLLVCLNRSFSWLHVALMFLRAKLWRHPTTPKKHNRRSGLSSP